MNRLLSAQPTKLSCLSATLAVVVLVLASQIPSIGLAQEAVTAIVGATVVDSNPKSPQDIADCVIVIRGTEIVRVGSRDEVPIPEGAEVIEANGKFVVPGLIDGFATLNDQSYANAYLHQGVTSIIGVSSTRRGPLVKDCSPSPHIYELESIGDEEISTDDAINRLEELHKNDIRIALLMYRLKPDQIRQLVERARQLGMGTIGELAETTYAEAIEAGVDAFVHTTRYSLDMAPAEMRRAVGLEPFSDKLDSPKWQYYLWLSRLTADDAVLKQHAKTLGEGSAALMPTAALLYLDHPFAKNPWHEEVARIIPRGLVNNPANAITGRHLYDPDHERAYAAVAKAELLIEKANYQAGATFLAGSATDVWGTMPGISLHHELELLERFGLKPREVLAAATVNIANAFRWEELGQVATGKRADLLILNDDPRKNIAALKNIVQVVLDGKVIERDSLLVVPRQTKVPNGTIISRDDFEIPSEYFVGADRSKELLDEYKYLENIEIETITYASDGLRVKGYLVCPRGDGKHPAIVYNRGGNREFGSLNPHKAVRILARMASWGYVVVGSQYRGTNGSDGMEQFGGEDVNDVLNLLPMIDAYPNADSTRIGMVGGSRGGLMTYRALTRTDRIRAAAIRCGVTDLTKWAGERPEMSEVFNDLIPEFDPNDPMSLKSRSPVYWVDQLSDKTPLLILQGTADWRVAPESALAMSKELLAHRHPFRLVMLEGSDHGLSEHRDEAWMLIRSWMNRYVRDLTPLPDTKPHGR